MTTRYQSLQRRYGTREERQRFLIYCEGELTEVTYFKGVRRELRAATIQIEIGPHHGEPYGLVRRAIAHQRAAPTRERDRFEAYDQVWCVFDVEAPQPHPRLDEALALARRHDIRCAVSNPCFELWILLHFVELGRYLTTDEACRRLERPPCSCGYSRNSKNVGYETLQSRREVACTRADHLDRRQDHVTTVRDRNPWTSVHTLVDALFRMT